MAKKAAEYNADIKKLEQEQAEALKKFKAEQAEKMKKLRAQAAEAEKLERENEDKKLIQLIREELKDRKDIVSDVAEAIKLFKEKEDAEIAPEEVTEVAESVVADEVGEDSTEDVNLFPEE
jgi:hypothetical protein